MKVEAVTASNAPPDRPARAPGRACARRATALGASPPASGRPLGPGGPPPNPREPVILGEREPRFGGSRGPRGPRERATGCTPFQTPVPRLRLRLNCWRM
jgi:hypothetical protein